MVESAPDRVVGDLRGALSGAGGDSGLVDVRMLVETEARDRQLRNAVLHPITPLCVGDGRTERLTFPARSLALVWRGLRDQATHEVGRAAALFEEFQADQSSPEPFDILARRAACGVRDRNHPKFAAAAELADAARPGGAMLLAECLEMVPVVRAAVGRLPRWIQRVTDEDAALARIAYKDSVEIAEDAGPRFFEMLAAHLTHPWMVLRLISAVMDKPPEAYLAGSELAEFGLRVLDGVDAGLAEVEQFDTTGGMNAVRAAAQAIDKVTAQIAELEGNVELARQGPWGGRLAKQKTALARLVEGRLREIPKAVDAVIPLTQVWMGRVSKDAARLTSPPDSQALQKAKTLVAFSQEIRGAANYGGFAAARTKVLEDLDVQLDTFTEDALDHLKQGDAPDPEVARALLNAAIELVALARDRQAADILRRRLAAI
ncbi:MAG: hypothetical protein Q7V15_08915 [Phenylobacterium sp.]|uniref:hypothetical protein n=1 Tax=Phenylobacterium sp. TaxID=1871053 RepID=UPI002719F6B3|nr:hypothetical protein [Phenylobacterium sp.]MDO8901461.1 hypothetical protein [Phenylobacterium sp.]